MIFPGCRAGGDRSVSDENDRLRQAAIESDAKTKALEGEVAELKIKLAEASARPPLTPEALAALPRVTSITVSSTSGFEPTDPQAPATGVTVWFEPLDGKGRFLQAVGTATVTVLLLPSELGNGSNQEPQPVASTVLSPTQLRDAYRSSFTGTHYAAELKLPQPVDRSGGKVPTLVIRVEFNDALTGQVLKGEQLISPKGPQKSARAG